MKKKTWGRLGRPPMTAKRELYVQLMQQGMTNSAACRLLDIDRKAGHWMKNGGVVVRNGVTRVVAPIVTTKPRSQSRAATSARTNESSSRTVSAMDGSARSIAVELGRAASTVAREIARNSDPETGDYRPHTAHCRMLARRPRPRPSKLATDSQLREVVQGYLDQRWSPEQAARAATVVHDMPVATETIYQALYSPFRVLQRDPGATLRTRRNHRRRRRSGEARRGRFVVPITMIEDRPDEAKDRTVAGHWEGDLIVGPSTVPRSGPWSTGQPGSRSWSTSTGRPELKRCGTG